MPNTTHSDPKPDIFANPNRNRRGDPDHDAGHAIGSGRISHLHEHAGRDPHRHDHTHSDYDAHYPHDHHVPDDHATTAIRDSDRHISPEYVGAPPAERIAVALERIAATLAAKWPGPDRDMGVPPTAAEHGEPDRADGVPDQAGRERTLPGPVGELRRAGLPGRGSVPADRLPDPNADRGVAPYVHAHFVYDGTGKPYRYIHSGTEPLPGHSHPGAGSGFDPDEYPAVPVIDRYPAPRSDGHPRLQLDARSTKPGVDA